MHDNLNLLCSFANIWLYAHMVGDILHLTIRDKGYYQHFTIGEYENF